MVNFTSALPGHVMGTRIPVKSSWMSTGSGPTCMACSGLEVLTAKISAMELLVTPRSQEMPHCKTVAAWLGFLGNSVHEFKAEGQPIGGQSLSLRQRGNLHGSLRPILKFRPQGTAVGSCHCFFLGCRVSTSRCYPRRWRG